MWQERIQSILIWRRLFFFFWDVNSEEFPGTNDVSPKLSGSLWKAESIGKATLSCDGCVKETQKETSVIPNRVRRKRGGAEWVLYPPATQPSPSPRLSQQLSVSAISASHFWPRQSLTHGVPPTSLWLGPRAVGGGSEQNHLQTKILGKWKLWEKGEKGIGISKSETFTVEKFECLNWGAEVGRGTFIKQTSIEYAQLNYSF